MSEADSTMDQVRNDHKLWGKHKWRGKFFASEEKEGKYLRQKGNLDDNVAEFLHAPSDGDVAGQQQIKQQPFVEASALSKWPSVAQVSRLNAGAPLYPRRKPPRNKNLRVTFSSAAPDFIGEGGDEAELPSREVVTSWKPFIPQQHMHDISVEQAAQVVGNDQSSAAVSQAIAAEKTASSLVSLRRKPTRAEDSQANDVSQSRESASPGYEESSVSANFDLKQQFQLGTQNRSKQYFKSADRMTSADHRAFQVQVEVPTSKLNVAETAGQEAHMLPEMSSLESTLPMGNSLTPTPSPRPAQKPIMSSYPFPASRQDGPTTPHNGSVPTERNYSPQYKDSSKPVSEAHPSLRSVTNHLGDTAIEDFGARVERFNEILRLGTTSFSSLTDISFAQWTRTSTWWFLKGRQGLESAVRGRTQSGDGPLSGDDKFISSELKQAYLDLAKAWWITKDIIPDHPDVRIYGDTSLKSLAAISKVSGDASLVEVIEAHLATITSMRALAMSMRRNNKLPPNDFEIQGLVTRVWLQYPKLSAMVRGLLSMNSPQMLLSSPSHRVENGPSIAVGDTERYFNYGSMFVEVSRDDGQAQMYLPCVLTMLRERSAWDLSVVIISQDGQVNLMIQNTEKSGLTWENIQWEIKAHVIQITLTSGFTVDVQLSEKDFKTLWGIRDYTRQVLKAFRCGKTEKIVFETNVQAFQYYGSKGSQTFPAEPIQGCKMRLFEKSIVSMEGSGERKVYDGHRLTVVTPPSVKTLSSIAHGLGKQIPILFSYLRGEDGAPAMLLKSPESYPSSSMVITFRAPSERQLFHALLDGTSITDDEFGSACMSLRSLSITEKPTEQTSPQNFESLMEEIQWHQLRILGKSHEGQDQREFQAVYSENLRIWADCDMGTLVDRISLRMYMS